MKRAIVVVGCVAVCLTLITGCISFAGGGSAQPDKQANADNTNLLVKIDVEKDGLHLDSLSSIVSQKYITISNIFREKSEKGNITSVRFSGNNIKKLSEDTYSMDYNLNIDIRIESNGNMQSMQVGSSSTINIKLRQPVCIYESNTYRVKLTIDTKK